MYFSNIKIKNSIESRIEFRKRFRQRMQCLAYSVRPSQFLCQISITFALYIWDRRTIECIFSDCTRYARNISSFQRQSKLTSNFALTLHCTSLSVLLKNEKFNFKQQTYTCTCACSDGQVHSRPKVLPQPWRYSHLTHDCRTRVCCWSASYTSVGSLFSPLSNELLFACVDTN